MYICERTRRNTQDESTRIHRLFVHFDIRIHNDMPGSKVWKLFESLNKFVCMKDLEQTPEAPCQKRMQREWGMGRGRGRGAAASPQPGFEVYNLHVLKFHILGLASLQRFSLLFD